MSDIQGNINQGDSIKLIAFHLPQFHVIPENNEWWGEGFTEWTNTKRAKQLYKGHNQPREPLNDIYYDLSDIESMIWQMQLAKQYGIYAFCYYHYWFNGRLLLEKPLEAIRNYQQDKLNYCLCWANEPWTRAWEGNTKEVLMAQEYGNEIEWEEHFLYLLSFFKDEYYVKISGKPVLVIYRSNNIPRCDEMISYWDNRCKEEGFEGVYLIEEMNCFQETWVCKNSSATLEFEPLYTMTYDRKIRDKILDKIKSIIFNTITGNNNQIYRYDSLWKNILCRNHTDVKKRYLGAFVDWDNTARKGKNGRIVMGATPDKFDKYISIQKQIAEKIGSEYIFINAWNEWGEGTYLEPDKLNKYHYLEKVLQVFDENKVNNDN